jgi:hypothetical protein
VPPVQPRRHPLLGRGVWVAPVVTPAGLDIAFACTHEGVQIAREEHEPADYDKVYARLMLLLDMHDPLPRATLRVI